MRHAKPYRLYFRKDTGYWFYKLPDQGWKTTGARDEHEAHRYVIKLLEEPEAPASSKAAGHVDPGRILLKDYALPTFDQYVKARRGAAGPKKPVLSDVYVKSIRGYLKRFVIEDPMGEIPIAEIRPDDFQAFQTRLLIEKLPDKRTTAVRALEAARLILRRAEKLGHIPRSPDRAIDTAQADIRSRGIYTDDELEALFPADVWEKNDFSPWANALDYTAGIVAASTGMRRNEVLALDWRAVHLKNGKEYLEILGSLKRGGGIGPTKGKRPRATPIFDFVLWPDRRAVKALQELRRRAAIKSKVRDMNGESVAEGPVIGTSPRHRCGATWWGRHFRDALKKAEIDRNRGEGVVQLDAHSLRHSLASRLKAAGLPDDLTRRFCGWASVNVQDRYTHIGADVFSRIMELVRETS